MSDTTKGSSSSKPKRKRRHISLPKLAATIEEFCDTHTFSRDRTVNELIEMIKDAWFEEAQNR